MQAILVAVSVILLQGVLGDLVVQTENGKVRGTTIDTPSGKTFYAWRGIPYGKPPVGELRYMAPVKPEPWNGVLDASTDSPACVFFGTFGGDPMPLSGNSEDCLYINVYSPVAVGSNSSVTSNLTVLVWIYGGGFYSGFSDFGFYDPTPFLEENVIVVSFNYRLGAFGYLSTGDDVIQGNAGLKDQVLALHWVQDNIASFGGSPKYVTIFGESAGAISVGYHVVSPLSRDLFQSAIMESGSALFSRPAHPDPKSNAANLANKIDSSITNASTSDEIKAVLQAAASDLVVQSAVELSFWPVAEIQSDTSFISKPLYEAVETGDIASVPVIIGYNSEESIFYAFFINGSSYDTNVEQLVPEMSLKENVSKTAIGQEIHDLYVGKDGLFADNLGTLLEWNSDNMFLRSSNKQAVLQCIYVPVYLYQFSFFGTLSKDNPIIPGAGKVGHAQELGYLFNISTKPIETEADFLTRRRFVKLWTNFAKYLNPTPDDDSAELLQHVKWRPITPDNVTYLDIDDDLQVKPNRKAREAAFWDYLWTTYGERPYNTF